MVLNIKTSLTAKVSDVRYLGRRFEFFQRRFTPVSVPSRSRQALFGTLAVDLPYTPSGAYSQKPPKILKFYFFLIFEFISKTNNIF